jgi:hypothetical protein
MKLHNALCLTLLTAATAASNPDTYFGGIDNEAYLTWVDSVDYQGKSIVHRPASILQLEYTLLLATVLFSSSNFLLLLL